MYADDITRAIMAETRHPVWGELFRRVLASELTIEDILFTNTIACPRPTWIAIINGGNPDFLEAVADIALTDFLCDVLMESDHIDRLEKTIAPEMFARRESWDPERFN